MIKALDETIHYAEFNKILNEMSIRYPFFYLTDFLEMYVDGHDPKDMMNKFHLDDYPEYYDLLRILKLNKERPGIKEDSSNPREINEKDQNILLRMHFFKNNLSKFEENMSKNLKYNILRAIIILKLHDDHNSRTFTSRSQIIDSLSEIILEFGSLLGKSQKYLVKNDEMYKDLVHGILKELQDHSFLEFDGGNREKFRLANKQLKIREDIIKIINNKRDGISKHDLLNTIKQKLPILHYLPKSFIEDQISHLLYDKTIKTTNDLFDTLYHFSDDNTQNGNQTYKKLDKKYIKKINPRETTLKMWNHFEDRLYKLFPSLRYIEFDYHASYRKDDIKVFSVVMWKSKFHIIFNMKKASLKKFKGIEDISKLGHWGNGKYRFHVTSDKDVLTAIDIIKEIYPH